MNQVKPKIRLIHHFACSGGTVISKCIQAMHNTVVLSEVHPNRLRYEFNPYDPVQLLLTQTSLGKNEKLRKEIFLQRVKQCLWIAKRMNLNLVLRDHTHSDYFMKNSPDTKLSKSSLFYLVKNDFDILSVVTVRNPIESYLSLVENKWDKNILNFTDYCDRLFAMLSHYQELGINIMRYEDFCSDPIKFMNIICETLDLEFNCEFENIYHKIPMTGDSGRVQQNKITKITQLTPKKPPVDLILEASKSKSYRYIVDQFDY